MYGTGIPFTRSRPVKFFKLCWILQCPHYLNHNKESFHINTRAYSISGVLWSAACYSWQYVHETRPLLCFMTLGICTVLIIIATLELLSREYIYNGNIFPSLNPAKIFQFISRWTESTKSSTVGPNHRAVINTSNELKSPLLWEFWIYNFSLRILERVLGWKHCKYKEWVSFFFLGSWGMNRSAEQTNRPRTASRFTRFVCPVLRFIPHEPRKKDTHSLISCFLHTFISIFGIST